MAPMYYVYELIDPRDGAVFYVGKGQGNRVSQHVRDAISGRICNQAKHDLILNIIDAGYLPIENIVAQFSEEDEALHYEAALIAEYGVNNLTNILESGSRSFNSLMLCKIQFIMYCLLFLANSTQYTISLKYVMPIS